jgi:hypothetical protein
VSQIWKIDRDEDATNINRWLRGKLNFYVFEKEILDDPIPVFLISQQQKFTSHRFKANENKQR